MAITYVGAATGWTSTASSTSYTINRPASVADGDLMIGVLAWSTGSTDTDLVCTVPSGWTKQDEIFNSGDGFDGQMCVMTRTYVAGDPASWSGTLSSTAAKVKCSSATAYRGVQSVLVKGTASLGLGSSYSTATVNNTVANSWRFTCGMYESASLTYALNTNEATSRATVSDVNGGDAVYLRLADSGAAIATGNTSRTWSRSANWDASTAWIGILREASGTAATGTFAISLGGVSVSSSGSVVDSATMALTLGNVTGAFDGYGAPPDVSGSFALSLGPVTADGAGATEPRGTLDTVVLPTVSFQVETRVFGIRVITIEDDGRLIIVPSRAVDD